MITSYKDLKVWQMSFELVKDVYLVTRKIPKSEMFGLISQMRRSAVSIPSNIAEGWMRQHTKEYIQFIYHALGSCGELHTQVMISENLNYISKIETSHVCEKLDHVGRMLSKLISSLNRQRTPNA